MFQIAGIMIVVLMLVYCELTWQIYRRKGKLCGIPKGLRLVNFGSTYAYYGLDYSMIDCECFNFSTIPQYLYYDYLLLKKYSSKIKEGADVLIVLVNFLFYGDGKTLGRTNEQYYFALSPKEIEGFDWKVYFKLRWNAVKEPITKAYQKKTDKWKGYTANRSEKEKHADKRVYDWEQKLGVSCKQKKEISEDLEAICKENKEILKQMVNWCRNKNFNPVIVTMPQSEIMRDRIKKDCLESYLLNHVKEIAAAEKVKWLDYTWEEDFLSQDLYMNSDCFNKEGRRLFTNRVYEDLRKE